MPLWTGIVGDKKFWIHAGKEMADEADTDELILLLQSSSFECLAALAVLDTFLLRWSSKVGRVQTGPAFVASLDEIL